MLSFKKIIIFLIILVLFFTLPLYVLAASDPGIQASSALLAELTSGKILYEKNKNEPRPPDSLAKLLTVYIAASLCENGEIDINEKVTMTGAAWVDITSRNTTQNILPGETMTLRDLLYCAYLGSANEACNMIAEYIAGSTDAFVDMMNAYAGELGCTGTNFTNTHGQYDSRQYTTAADQFLIYSKAIKNPLFAEITTTYRYFTESTNKSDARRLTNPNHMLNPDSKYYYRYCTGGRPSATYEGGYSLVASAEKDGSVLVSVILGSDAIILEDESTLMRNLSETKRLLEWGFSEFGWRTLLSDGELVAKAPVTYGDGADYVNLRPQSAITVFLESSIETDEFVRNVTVYSVEKGERLYAPVSAGETLGELTLSRGGIEYGTVSLIANTDVGLHRMEYVKSQIKDLLTSTPAIIIISGILVLLIAYIALVIHYNKLRRERLRKVAEMKKKIIEERRQKDQ